MTVNTTGVWSTESHNKHCLLTGGSGSDQLCLGLEVLTKWALSTLPLTAHGLARSTG